MNSNRNTSSNSIRNFTRESWKDSIRDCSMNSNWDFTRDSSKDDYVKNSIQDLPRILPGIPPYTFSNLTENFSNNSTKFFQKHYQDFLRELPRTPSKTLPGISPGSLIAIHPVILLKKKYIDISLGILLRILSGILPKIFQCIAST